MNRYDFCFITDNKVIKNFTGYTIPYKSRLLSVEKYLIEINDKEFMIYISGLDEDLIEEIKISKLEPFKPILKKLIEEKDKRVQGIFCWNDKNTPDNFIKLEKLLEEL